MLTSSARPASPQGSYGLAPGETRTAICPICEYDKPSLRVTNKRGKLLVCCFNRCDQDRLYRATMALLRDGKLDWAGRSTVQKRADTADHRTHAQLFEPLHAMWRAAVDVADHPIARRYLEGRRCVIPPRGCGLRAVDSACHHRTGTHWPALVGRIIGDEYFGDAALPRPVSIHTTFLAPDGSGKAPVQPDRLFAKDLPSRGVVELTGGDYRYSYLSLGECFDSRHLGVAEGIETALSLAHAVPVTWACLNAGNLAELKVPFDRPLSLTIAVDRDKAGEHAALACAKRWRAAGIKVRLIEPEQGDVNDLVRETR